MQNRSANRHAFSRQACLAIILALVGAAPACGDLDEKDTTPPSVEALTRWDSSHVLALRTYYENAAIVDLHSGRKTGELKLGRYYRDIKSLGNGTFVAVHNQWIDFIHSDGRVDTGRSIPGGIFGGVAVSADLSTLAYSDYGDSQDATVHVVSLQDGIERLSPPGAYNGANNDFDDGLVLSGNGNLVAFINADVGFAKTYASNPPPDPNTPEVPAVARCVLKQLNPNYGGGAMTIDFSPVQDQLAVASLVGFVEIFDLSDQQDCQLLLAIPDVDSSGMTGRIGHLRYSPDGSVLAATVERSEYDGTSGITSFTIVIRLFDATTGALRTELPAYQWQSTDPLGSEGPMVTDLLWSDAGDRLTVSAWNGPVQCWDIASATLLWEARL